MREISDFRTYSEKSWTINYVRLNIQMFIRRALKRKEFTNVSLGLLIYIDRMILHHGIESEAEEPES